LRDDEDVGEDDGGVDEAVIAVDGLKGEGRCDLGGAAAFKEVVGAFELVVFRKVATSFMYESIYQI
jgi:hypothetical protein